MTGLNNTIGVKGGGLPEVVKTVLHLGLIVFMFMIPGMLMKTGLLAPWQQEVYQFLSGWHEFEYLRNPWIASCAFIIISSLMIGIGVPRLWISSLAGWLFGIPMGVFVSLTASVLGTATVYQAGRYLLVKRFESHTSLGGLQKRFRRSPFVSVLYARLFPFSNSTLVSLFSGACQVCFIKFLAASLIGFFPLTLVFCLVGNGSSTLQAGQIIMGFVLIILLHLVVTITNKKVCTEL